jgi:uncharacterized protein
MTRTDPILGRVRRVLNDLYGERIERIILFGSRARGDSGPDSDYDVAVFLHGITERATEVQRLAEIQTALIDEADVFVHAMPFPAGAWADRTPLMHEIRLEGQDL